MYIPRCIYIVLRHLHPFNMYTCHYKGRMCTFIVSRDKDTVRGLIECPSQWSVISSVNMMCGMSSDIIPLSPFDLIVSL